jgi:ATP-binding cassette, subfamily B, bacterial HlyB/CyaB
MHGDGIMQIKGESLVWALSALAQLNRTPFDPRLVRQQFPPPCTLETLHEASASLGLKVGLKQVQASDLSQLRLPCLGVLEPAISSAGDAGSFPLDDPKVTPIAAARNGDKLGGADDPSAHDVVLIVQADAEHVSYFDGTSPSIATLGSDEFAERFTGQVLLFVRQAPAAAKDPGEMARPREFGFSWFVPELLKHKHIWRDVLLASLVIQLVALATPLFTQVIIDKVVVHQTLNTLVVIGVALVVFMLFTALLSWVRQYLVLHTGNRVDAVLGSQVFDQLLKLPLRYHQHRPTGVVVARIQGVETIRQFVSSAAVTLLLDCPFLLIFLGVMVYYNWLLTLITLGVLIVIVAISFAVTPVFRSRLNQQFLLGARNQAFLTEYVSGMETVKSLQMEPQLKTRFEDYLATYLDASFAARQLANTYNVVATTLDQLLTVLILCAGAWMVMRNDGFTIGMLVAFQMFSSRLSQPMLRLVGLWQEFQQAAIAVKRLGDIMNAPIEPYSLIPARAGSNQGRIEVQRLSFRYAQDLPDLFSGLSLTLEPGQCVALMGPSGSGKSTLAKLLQGFYQPSEGQIKVDGYDIRHLSANELRNHFGVVPQETTLFSGTIYENLILANPLAGFGDVVQACRMAEIHQTIEQLPQGYQTEIGEHGAGLSGGQKQRIAIARALLKRPKVLIFDEATSNLDEETAEQFARTVSLLKGQATMLFIAHQLPKGLRVDATVTLGAVRMLADAERAQDA